MLFFNHYRPKVNLRVSVRIGSIQVAHAVFGGNSQLVWCVCLQSRQGHVREGIVLLHWPVLQPFPTRLSIVTVSGWVALKAGDVIHDVLSSSAVWRCQPCYYDNRLVLEYYWYISWRRWRSWRERNIKQIRFWKRSLNKATDVCEVFAEKSLRQLCLSVYGKCATADPQICSQDWTDRKWPPKLNFYSRVVNDPFR